MANLLTVTLSTAIDLMPVIFGRSLEEVFTE